MALSWRQGTVVETDRIETIADGVAGRCPIPEVLDDLLVVLDDVALVSEDSIKAGMRALYEHAGLVVEPSAALGVAAVLEDRERFAGRRVTTILCGSNVGAAEFARWVLEPAARGESAAPPAAPSPECAASEPFLVSPPAPHAMLRSADNPQFQGPDEPADQSREH
jgi:threonine dehydratase